MTNDHFSTNHPTHEHQAGASRRNTGAGVVFAALLLATIAGGVLVGRMISSPSPAPEPQRPAPAASRVAASPSVDTATAVEVGTFSPVVDVAEATPSNGGAAQADEAGEIAVGVRLDVLRFVQDFDNAHMSDDLIYLLGSLHPAVSEAFGDETCRSYVESTMGSVGDMWVANVGTPTTFELPGPDGPIVFADAIPVDAGWTIVHSGEEQEIRFHVVHSGDSALWLTTCGWNAAT